MHTTATTQHPLSSSLLPFLSDDGRAFVERMVARGGQAFGKPVSPQEVQEAKEDYAGRKRPHAGQEHRSHAAQALLALVERDPRIAFDRHPYYSPSEPDWACLMEIGRRKGMPFDLSLAPLIAGLVPGETKLRGKINPYGGGSGLVTGGSWEVIRLGGSTPRYTPGEGPTLLEWCLEPQSCGKNLAKAICAHYGVELHATDQILGSFHRPIYGHFGFDDYGDNEKAVGCGDNIQKDRGRDLSINLDQIIPGAPSPLVYLVGCQGAVQALDDLLDAGADPTARVWTWLTGRVPLICALLSPEDDLYAPMLALRLIERAPQVLDQIPDFNATAIATRDAWLEHRREDPMAVQCARDLDALRMIRAQTRSTKPLPAKPRSPRVF